MTNEELISSISQFEPEKFEKTAHMIALTELMVPEFAKEASEDLLDILTFTQEKMSEYDEKTKVAHGGGGGGGHGGGGMGGMGVGGASMGHGYRGAIGGGLKTVGMGIGAGLGAALLTNIASDLYDAATRSLSKAKNYKAIMRQNPELATKYDKALLQRSFSTLHSYAPEFTADPQLGGQLLNAMAETAGSMGQFSTVKDLINSRKTLRDVKAKQFEPRFQFGPSKSRGGKHGEPVGSAEG